ncbi:The BURPS668_1122 family of deaminases [Seinonella peptonophila]|uniref:The BURPS668_1122 family of deaminases n=1 Tax=Seinonella peptonophila TaxID=112248 RepID=A0A1M5BIS2_9BACL|nr:The BURPS668_1122 family of deaminases [Seinonella peptonophila]
MLKATSRVKPEYIPPGWLHTPSTHGFKVLKVNDKGEVEAYNSMVRTNDSELRIFAHLANKLVNNPDATGTVRLFSERPVCVSCQGVVMQFKQMFKNIRIIVHSNDQIGISEFNRLSEL